MAEGLIDEEDMSEPADVDVEPIKEALRNGEVFEAVNLGEDAVTALLNEIIRFKTVEERPYTTTPGAQRQLRISRREAMNSFRRLEKLFGIVMMVHDAIEAEIGFDEPEVFQWMAHPNNFNGDVRKISNKLLRALHNYYAINFQKMTDPNWKELIPMPYDEMYKEIFEAEEDNPIALLDELEFETRWFELIAEPRTRRISDPGYIRIQDVELGHVTDCAELATTC